MKQFYQIIFQGLNLAGVLHFSKASSEGLGGIHLKFTGYHSPPYDYLKLLPDGNYTITGFHANIIKWLSEKLNFTYNLEDVVVDQVLIAKYGVYDLALDKLGKNGIDALMSSLIVNSQRAQKVDYAPLAWSEPYTIVAPKPEQKSRLFAFIRPFQPMVWFFLAASSIIIIAIMTWFSYIFNNRPIEKSGNWNDKPEKKNTSRASKVEELNNSIGYYFIYVVNILTNHGIYSPYAQQSFRILAAGWLLAALVLVNSYSSIIVSSLTVPTMKPAVNTLEDFVNNEDVSIIISTDVVLSKTIMNATTGIFKTLADIARKNPNDRLHTSLISLLKKLETGHFGFPFIETFNRHFIGLQYKKDGKCRFRMSPPLELSTGYFSLLVRKKFPYTSTFSRGLTYLWETGFPRHWMMNSLPKAEECFVKNKESNSASIQKINPIKLKDLVSAFLILGIGIGLGVLTFLIELIIQ